MLTVPENIGAISYGGDNSPVEQSQQLLSCIPGKEQFGFNLVKGWMMT